MRLGEEGNGRDLAVEGVAVAVGREVVKHRVADQVEGLAVTGEVHRLRFLDPLFDEARTGIQVGIAEGQDRTVEHGPSVKQRTLALEVDDRAVVRSVETVGTGFHGAVGLFCQHLDNLALDLAPLAVVVVLQRVVRVELQLVQAEPVGVGHGVRPRQVLVEPDTDDRGAVQRRAGHVVHTGNGQVGLVPGALAEPGLVGVAQQDARPGLGGVATQREAVGPEVAGIQVASGGPERVGGLQQVRRTAR